MSFTRPRGLAGAAAAAAIAAFAVAPAHAVKATDPQDVRIVNTADEPVPVVIKNGPPPAPAEEHVQVFKAMNVPGNETNFNEVLLSVPAGKKFIAQQINGEASTLPQGTVKAQVAALRVGPDGPRSVTFTLPLTPALGNEVDSLKRGIFNEEMHFEVAGPGEVIGTIARFGPKPDSTIGHGWALVGTLVDCPSCQAQTG